jgi:hypothetical protein
MKKLILMLALVATAAQAETWLEMPNEAGGKIILMQDKCQGKNEGRFVIATTPKGDNVMGCWWYFSDMIHIVWNNGRTSSFEPSSFTAREKK